MKFVIEKNALAKALSHVQSVVERRNTLLIIANVLIQAKGDRIRLTATDMELEIVEEVGAEVIEEGETTAPAALVHEYVRKLDDGSQVEISLVGDRLMLKSGRASLNQPTMPVNEFPLMDAKDLSHNFGLPTGDLKALFERTRFAISTEETRYYLNGVFFHATEDAKLLRAVATDGHRMARMERELPASAAGMPSVIVPKKTVNELVRLLDEGNGEVEIALGPTKIRFEIGDLVLTSKLIDGKFPEYDRVIPQGNPLQLEVDQRQLRTAIDRVATVLTERTRTVKMEISDHRAVLSSNSPEQGEAQEEVAVDYSDEDITIGFNSRYLIDILDNISGTRASFFMKEDTTPIIITDPNDETVLFLLMPLRV